MKSWVLQPCPYVGVDCPSGNMETPDVAWRFYVVLAMSLKEYVSIIFKHRSIFRNHQAGWGKATKSMNISLQS